MKSSRSRDKNNRYIREESLGKGRHNNKKNKRKTRRRKRRRKREERKIQIKKRQCSQSNQLNDSFLNVIIIIIIVVVVVVVVIAVVLVVTGTAICFRLTKMAFSVSAFPPQQQEENEEKEEKQKNRLPHNPCSFCNRFVIGSSFFATLFLDFDRINHYETSRRLVTRASRIGFFKNGQKWRSFPAIFPLFSVITAINDVKAVLRNKTQGKVKADQEMIQSIRPRLFYFYTLEIKSKARLLKNDTGKEEETWCGNGRQSQKRWPSGKIVKGRRL